MEKTEKVTFPAWMGSRGRIFIPKAAREALGIADGRKHLVEVTVKVINQGGEKKIKEVKKSGKI